jgi:hypothetical protein
VREKAFLQLGLETRKIALSDHSKKFTNASGNAFVKLSIPKVYCFGDKGGQQESIPFLNEHGIKMIKLPTDSHWVAQSCPNALVTVLKSL